MEQVLFAKVKVLSQEHLNKQIEKKDIIRFGYSDVIKPYWANCKISIEKDNKYKIIEII